MQSEDLLDLRKRVDHESSDIRWLLHKLALDAGLRFIWTPPYIGKLLNMIEILWSISKRRLRKLLTKADRANDAAIIDALERSLGELCQEKLLLDNICLPSMRVAFAVIKAVFRGERVMHTKKPVLFAELFQACCDFGDDLRAHEADEHSDRGALLKGIPFVMPELLVIHGLPTKIEDVFKEDDDGLTLLSPGKLAAKIEELKKHDEDLKSNLRRTKRAPATRADSGLKVGDWVHYSSKTTGRIIYARIEGFNANGTIRIDKKPSAVPEKISIPYRSAPGPEPERKKRKTKIQKELEELEVALPQPGESDLEDDVGEDIEGREDIDYDDFGF